MQKHTVETVIFKLNDGVSYEAFVEAASAVTTFVQQRSGFVSRRLSCNADGLWIEHIEWRTLEDAKSAASEIGKESSLAQFMRAIDGTSVTLHHSTLEISAG